MIPNKTTIPDDIFGQLIEHFEISASFWIFTLISAKNISTANKPRRVLQNLFCDKYTMLDLIVPKVLIMKCYQIAKYTANEWLNKPAGNIETAKQNVPTWLCVIDRN